MIEETNYREKNLYNYLKDLSKDDIIGITIREFNENKYFREVKIGEYLKEIQQLKKQPDLYKSVLDEIREYIEKDYSFAKRHDIPLLTKDEQLASKLFEILDKGMIMNDS